MLRVITSRDNPLIKRLHKLAESSRTRRAEGLAIIEGVHLIDAALNMHWPLQEVLVSESGNRDPEVLALLARTPAAHAYLVPDALFVW